MSRAAVFTVLTEDEDLNDLGINEDSVFPNYSLDECPVADGPFLILKWEGQEANPFGKVKSPVVLTIWAHYPADVSEDFADLDLLLDAVDAALETLDDTEGEDGYTVTCVRATGRGGDLKDEGFHTIAKNSAYEVLSRKS